MSIFNQFSSGYVDSIAQGLSWKESVFVATTGNVVLSGEQTIDGIATTTGDRVLVKEQSLGTENGIYIISTGVWSRSTDLPLGASASGSSTLVNEGTLNGGIGFLCNNTKGLDVVGTDNLVFIQFTGAGSLSPGQGIDIVGNTISVDYDNLTIGVLTNQIQVKDLGITSAKIGIDAVTTTKILNGNVTNAKLANSSLTVTAGDGLQNGGNVSLGSSVTLNVDNTVLRITGNQTASGIQNFTNTTQSINSTTGAVVISGGLGIAKDLFSLGKIETSGTIEGTSLSDGVATLTSGNFTGLSSVNSTALNSSTLQSASISDGFATLTSGTLTGGVNITCSGIVTCSSLTDGVATLSSGTLTGLVAPSSASDAANKSYVDGLSSGINYKDPCRVASTGNLVLSGEQTIDGVATVTGDRVLLKDQTNKVENGIYVVDTGAWSRSSDMASGSAENFASFVEEGSTNSGASYVITATSPFTIGTSDLTWTQFAGGSTINAGIALNKVGNTLNVLYDNLTIDVSSNLLQVKDLSITSAKLGTDSVITAKILNVS